MSKTTLRIVVVGAVICLFAAGCATNGETETAEPMMETEVVPERVPEAVPEKVPEAVPETIPEAVPEEVPEPEPRVLDDFEEEILWKPADWKNSNPVEVSPVQVDGENALLIQSAAGDQDKAAIVRPMEDGLDTTGYGKLTLEVHLKGEKTAGLSVAFTTGAFYETPSQELEPGRNEVTFDLTGENFKTGPHWEPNKELMGRHFVKEMFLILYTPEAREAVVDNIRLEN